MTHYGTKLRNNLRLAITVNDWWENRGLILGPANHNLGNLPYKRKDEIRHALGACAIYLMRGDLALNPQSLNGHAEGNADAQLS